MGIAGCPCLDNRFCSQGDGAQTIDMLARAEAAVNASDWGDFTLSGIRRGTYDIRGALSGMLCGAQDAPIPYGLRAWCEVGMVAEASSVETGQLSSRAYGQ